jgi:hypothetical protein
MTTRNTAVYPPQPKNAKGETHRDMGVISDDKARKLLVFRQFHSEGFVSQYVQDAAAGTADTVVFVTEAIENIPTGWRAKETCPKTGPDTMVETFELAAPGKPFEVYSVCRLTRVKQASHRKQLQHLVAVVVHHLHGDSAGGRRRERAAPGRLQRGQRGLVNLGPKRALQLLVRLVGAGDVRMPHEEALAVVLRIHEPARHIVG